jgi:putative hydrolase of the HAD superfamily
MSDPPQVRAVILDWGGTLTRWRAMDIAASWVPVARVALPGAADPEVLALAARLTAADAAVWARSRAGCEGGTFAEVLTACAVDSVVGLVDAHAEYWTPATQLDPDAPALLRGLRERGLKVGVLSNTIWPACVHDAWFVRDGVHELIDAACYSSEIGWMKPGPGAFTAAAAALGVDPAEVVFVGDRPFEDILGASRVGMRTAWVPYTELAPHELVGVDARPDVVLKRLTDLLVTLDAWSGVGSGRR